LQRANENNAAQKSMQQFLKGSRREEGESTHTPRCRCAIACAIFARFLLFVFFAATTGKQKTETACKSVQALLMYSS